MRVLFTAAVALCLSVSVLTVNPVVFVPGDGGSRLVMSVNLTKAEHIYCFKHVENKLAWVNVEYFVVPFIFHCLKERLTFRFNPQTNTTSDPPGVKITTPGWGVTRDTEYIGNLHIPPLKYFVDIVDALVDYEGYERGKTIRAAPYDFRKGFAELKSFKMNLTRLIEDTYTNAGNQPVILMAHSYGCLLALQLLQDANPAWKAKYVRSYVSLDGPYYGSIVPIRMFISGYNLNIPIVKPSWLRSPQRSWPSSYALMPDARAWSAKEILVKAPNKNYTIVNLKELFTDLGDPNAARMYELNRGVLNPEIPPGVESFCIHGLYGDGKKTDAWLDYSKDEGWPYDAENPKIAEGAGDGTVPLRSLIACKSWKYHQTQPSHYFTIDGAEHVKILINPKLIQYIRETVLDHGAPA